MTNTQLSDALNNLVKVAAEARLDPEAARTEGQELAAAVAESSRGAFVSWSEQLGIASDAEVFIEAAMRGRRYRTSGTPILTGLANSRSEAALGYAQALVEVCTAAALLGEPGPTSTGAAQMAASAQLAVASGTGPQPVPGPPRFPGGEDEFASRAPYILTSVLGRLGESQQRLLDLRSVDPGVPGAIPGLGPTPTQVTPPPAAAQPTEPKAPEEPPKPAEPEKTLEELLAELDGLVGLKKVKAEIHRQTAVLRVESLRMKVGLKSPTITRHLVFVGNPGTGKTTVARLVSGIYRAIGLLSKGQLVEVDRSELVAGYLGQTAMKTAEVVAKAEGGVLFIDEAYSLNGDQYGEEAINTLVKEMEDKRDDLVVIVAGYPLPMAEFISQNPGLASRFRTTIYFDDYSDEELVGIFTGMVAGADYDLGAGCVDAFKGLLAQQIRDETFGNGRFSRNTLEAAIGKHAWRLREVAEPTLEQLRTLLPEDITPDPEPAVEFGAAESDTQSGTGDTDDGAGS